MTDFCWLVEAPGPRYLAAREIMKDYEFYWTVDPHKALRFVLKDQADLATMAIRRLAPDLFQFAFNLGDARIVEHGFISDTRQS